MNVTLVSLARPPRSKHEAFVLWLLHMRLREQMNEYLWLESLRVKAA